MRILILLFSFSLVVSCSGMKTQEDIERDKLVDNMNVRQEQNQKMVAEQTVRFSQIEETFQMQNGKFEELQHEIQQLKTNQGAQTEERLKTLETQVSTLQKEQKKIANIVVKIEAQLNNQKSYLKKVTTGIAKISGDDTSGSTKGLLAKARKLSDKGKFKQASEIYNELLGRKVSAATKNRIYHGMGIVSYRTKKYEDALTLFSKIYTKYPKSSMASNSLYFIGKVFLKQNKKEEAKATFTQLLEQYPKKYEVKLVKKELNELK